MKTQLTIRTGDRNDAAVLHALHTVAVTTCCATHYEPVLIARWIQYRTPEGYYEGLDSGVVFVGEHNGVIVGFGHSVPGEVVGLFVHPEWVNRGFGGVLLDYALKLARENWSDPIKVISTLNARPFYAKHGFCFVKETTVIRNNTDIPVIEMELEN